MKKIIDKFIDEYRFLSNFYYHIIFLEDLACPTLEHAYQASKTLDQKERLKIVEAKSPGQAKKLGIKISKSDKLRSDWFKVNVEIMEKLLIQKFSDSELKKILLNTENSILIEGNSWHDNFFGNCTCIKCKDIKGENHLGKLLMKIREKLK
jgi:ribA/ribD-fused uncharacterized protein